MNNPFQDQLLKAGMATKKQVQKAKQARNKKNKQQRSQKEASIDESRLNATRLADEKAFRDRELNKKKVEEARLKAIVAEVDQLISKNRVSRDEGCELAYNFTDNNKVERIYINEEMRQKIINGGLGIACLAGQYELVVRAIAEKIQQRDDTRIFLSANEQAVEGESEDDPYADYQIPDDLIW